MHVSPCLLWAQLICTRRRRRKCTFDARSVLSRRSRKFLTPSVCDNAVDARWAGLFFSPAVPKLVDGTPAAYAVLMRLLASKTDWCVGNTDAETLLGALHGPFSRALSPHNFHVSVPVSQRCDDFISVFVQVHS